MMMLKQAFLLNVAFTLCLVLGATGNAENLPEIHPLFSDHMVLQRDKSLPVWGWTKANTKVTVKFAGKETSTTADKNGKWVANIGPFEASAEPRTLTIETSKITVLNDVLVGDVWICSGQSNMEWPVAASNNAKEEITKANHPNVRLFTVPRRVAFVPKQTVEGSWAVCSPQSIAQFSAVGYFFGREVHERVNVPVGLIHTSWGGTIAEAWTSDNGLEDMPDFKEPLTSLSELRKKIASGSFDLDKEIADWWSRNGASDEQVSKWTSPAFRGESWKEITLPNNFENANVGLEAYDGLIWFRKTFELPEDWSEEKSTLNLGAIDDADTTWVNGKRVGGKTAWTDVRKYELPEGTLRSGTNVIAVQVFDSQGNGGIYDKARGLSLTQGDNTISLNGEWTFKVTRSKKELTRFPQSLQNNPNQVTVLYNGMLSPLKPFGIRGAIWYQGESNAGRQMQYRRLLPTMIADWRKSFQQGDFPFLVVQLANFLKQQMNPVEPGGWAELREAQLLTAQRDPQVGLAITTDIGEALDIHPRNKQDVGKRLALQAMEITYGQKIVSSGPTLKDMGIVGDSLRLTFNNVGSGLSVRGEKLKGFAIAEAEGDFVWADAKIQGNDIILSNSDLAEPIRVRYNWANNPIGNLYNNEGLPAGPFRTDVPPTKN